MKRSRARSPDAIEFAKSERATANEFAGTVWQWVRNRQICKAKFRREYPIPPYTVDFCCVELKLVLEIDGTDHFTAKGKQRDRVRDEVLERQDYRVVRIAGYDVLREADACLERIREEVRGRMREMGEGPSPRDGARGDRRINQCRPGGRGQADFAP
ncbi:MAG TPA: endonuclease domain-containing protein [Pirellulales bacterium]|jgi:very-short-patch-repair endonuclease